jgi:hypothetical protein
MVPLRLSFGNHLSYDEEDSAFEVMQTSSNYDCLLPESYLEKDKTSATTTSHLNFLHFGPQFFSHNKLHPEYSITYNQQVAVLTSTTVFETPLTFLKRQGSRGITIVSLQRKFIFDIQFKPY